MQIFRKIFQNLGIALGLQSRTGFKLRKESVKTNNNLNLYQELGLYPLPYQVEINAQTSPTWMIQKGLLFLEAKKIEHLILIFNNYFFRFLLLFLTIRHCYTFLF